MLGDEDALVLCLLELETLQEMNDDLSDAGKMLLEDGGRGVFGQAALQANSEVVWD